MRAGNELTVARMNDQVVYRRGTQSAHEALPRLTAVDRHIRTHVGTHEQQILILQVFADHMHEIGLTIGQVVHDRRERAAEVGGHEHVRRVIVVAMIVERHVERRAVEMRRLDARHVAAGRHAREVLRHFFPLRAIIAREPHAAVVGTGVQQARAHRRFIQRHHRAERLGAGYVGRDTAGGLERHIQLGRIGVREFTGNGEHVVAVLHTLEHAVGAEVQRGRIVLGDDVRRVPVPAQRVGHRVAPLTRPIGRHLLLLRRCGRLGGIGPHGVDGIIPLQVATVAPRGLAEACALTGREVEATHAAALRFAVHDVGVRLILLRHEAVAAAHVVPHGVGDGALLAPARTAPRTVVLQAAAHAVRHAHVGRDVIELAQRDGIRKVPVATTIVRHADATVVAGDDALRIIGIDPHGVMVHVNAFRGAARRLAAVARVLHRRGRPVHAVRILRVDTHLRVVERTRVLGAHVRPRLAGVFRAIEATRPLLRRDLGVLLEIGRRVGFDHGVHHVGVRARDGDLDASLGGGRKSAALHLGERFATVGALPERRSGAARLQEVRSAHALVARGPHGVRVARVQLHVHEAGLLVDELHQAPVLAAVGGLVEPAFLVRSPGMTEGRYPHGVGIGGVHLNATDGARVGEAEEGPRLAAVGRLVDAATGRDGIARIRFAGAPVDHVGIRRGDREITTRRHAGRVHDGLEGGAVIGGLPQAAAGGGHVERLRGRRDAFDIDDPSHHVGGADVAPTQGVDDRVAGGGLGRQRRLGHERTGHQAGQRGTESKDANIAHKRDKHRWTDSARESGRRQLCATPWRPAMLSRRLLDPWDGRRRFAARRTAYSCWFRVIGTIRVLAVVDLAKSPPVVSRTVRKQPEHGWTDGTVTTRICSVGPTEAVAFLADWSFLIEQQNSEASARGDGPSRTEQLIRVGSV